MILKQRLGDGQTHFIDIGNSFSIITKAYKEWDNNTYKDAHSLISYMDDKGVLRHEPLYKDFIQWIYSNDGQLFLNLGSVDYR